MPVPAPAAHANGHAEGGAPAPVHTKPSRPSAAGENGAANGGQLPYASAAAAQINRPGSACRTPLGGTPVSIEGHGGLLKQQLNLRQRMDGSGVEVAPLQDELQFDKGFFVVVRAIQLLLSAVPDRPITVGLGGPSGAGKTELTSRLRKFMPMAVISMDNYIDTTEIIDQNFDDPRLTDFGLLVENLQGLRQGKTVRTPVYSFKESRRVGYADTAPPPGSRVCLIEGIYALHENVRPYLDLTVAVHGGVHFDLVKRIMRDVHRSNQAPREIIQQISETVFPMYKAFIEPDLYTATIRIKNTFNPFAGFLTHATYTLKSDRAPDVAAVRALLGGAVERREQETCDIFMLPPGEDPETCKDWIRMRLRDGRYSLLFEEYVADGDVIISPSMSFEVPVRVLSGLMSLGYQIGAIIKRQSVVYERPAEAGGAPRLCCKFDDISQLDREYFQIESDDRVSVEEAGDALGLGGSYIPKSYIEQVQLERLLVECQPAPGELQSALRAAGEAPRASGGSPHGGAPNAPCSPGGTHMFVASRVGSAQRLDSRADSNGSGGERPGARRALALRPATPANTEGPAAADTHCAAPAQGEAPPMHRRNSSAQDREALAELREGHLRLEKQLSNITLMLMSPAAAAATAPQQHTAGPPLHVLLATAAGLGIGAFAAAALALVRSS